eukprot:6249513-Ditylum_brightwellii.AAC.3
MTRLAERGNLPSAINYVEKAPPFAACLYARHKGEHGATRAKEIVQSERLITPHQDREHQ